MKNIEKLKKELKRKYGEMEYFQQELGNITDEFDTKIYDCRDEIEKIRSEILQIHNLKIGDKVNNHDGNICVITKIADNYVMVNNGGKGLRPPYCKESSRKNYFEEYYIFPENITTIERVEEILNGKH